MDYWKGPHSTIISATKGLEEYRQIHLAEVNPGLWPTIRGVETNIPVERKIDGVAGGTFESALSPLLGRKQTQLAFKDEVNVSGAPCSTPGRRTRPDGTRWRSPARRSAPGL